jgi:rubrerythrin
MIDEERAHEKQLTEWAELEDLSINRDIGPVRWEDPGVATTYDAEATDPDQSTPYKALAFAVHNEERAFRFYSYVAANCRDPVVRSHAEVLAHEELGHAAVLRALRRRAWHAQRRQHGSEPKIDPGLINGMPDLLAATVCIEQVLAGLIGAAAREHPDLETLAVPTEELLSTCAKSQQEGDIPGAELATALKSIASWRKRTMAAATNTAQALRLLSAGCDRNFAFYDSIVASTRDESVMLMAQRFSALALERIAKLRQLTDRSDNTGYTAAT